MRRIVSVLACLLAATYFVLVPYSLRAEGQQLGKLSIEPYLFEAKNGEKVPAELGHLTLRENPTNHRSKHIQIAFVRFKAVTDRPGFPIVYLAGGPGGSGIELARGPRFPLFMALRQLGDVIALDQRGTGLATPRLDCPELFEYPLEKPVKRLAMLHLFKDYARSCAAYWRGQKIDLSAYNTNNNADDLVNLREALGVKKFRLVAMSYGTHLALTAIRRHPESIERAVLAGVEGPDHTLKLPNDIQKHLEHISDLIAAHPKAGKLLPDFERLLKKLIAQLNPKAARITVTDTMSGHRVSVVLDGFDVQSIAGALLGRRSTIRLIPKIFGPAATGDLSALASYAHSIARGSRVSAMGAVMDCASGASPGRKARIAREADKTVLGTVINFPMPEWCDAWGVSELEHEFRAPVRANLPVLFISGTLDGRTPISNAKEVRHGFPNSTHLIVDGVGHEDGLLITPSVLDSIVEFMSGNPVPNSTISASTLEFVFPDQIKTSNQVSPTRGSSSGRALVFQNVNLIDGTGSPAQPDMTVIVQEGRIVAVGKASQVAVQNGTSIVNGRDKYLIPGLWDMHVHLSKIGETALPLFIANGVTSVRDMGSDLDEVIAWREEILAGQRVGPRIKTPGPILESTANVSRMKDEGVVEPVGRTRIGVSGPEVAATVVESLARRGVDFIKIRTFSSRESYFSVGEAAKRLGLTLVGHAFGVLPEDVLRAGQRSIEHFLYPVLDDWTDAERMTAFKKFSREGVVIIPTLVSGRDLLFVPNNRAAAITQDNQGDIDWRRKYISEHLLRDWREQVAERTAEKPPDLEPIMRSATRNLREMHRAGVKVLPGTDAAVLLIYPGFSLHDELELLVETVGITPMEAILSATRYPAEFFELQDSLGTISLGKSADMVLLEANPLESIANTRRIAGVMSGGMYFDRHALQGLLDGVERAVTSKSGEAASTLEVPAAEPLTSSSMNSMMYNGN